VPARSTSEDHHDVNDSPLCAAAQPTSPLLWPPNHKMVPVGITGVAVPDNDKAQIAITGVTQDEPARDFSHHGPEQLMLLSPRRPSAPQPGRRSKTTAPRAH